MGFLLFMCLLVMAVLVAALVIGAPLGVAGGVVAAWKAGGLHRGVVAAIFVLGLACWVISNLAAGGSVSARETFWVDLLFIIGLALAIRVRGRLKQSVKGVLQPGQAEAKSVLR